MTTTDGDGAQGSEAGTCVSQGVKLASQDFQAQASSRIPTHEQLLAHPRVVAPHSSARALEKRALEW